MIIRSASSSTTRACKNQKKKKHQKVSKCELLALSCKLFWECIKACKYASMQVCKYANFQEWSPTIPRMVTHQPKDGHPPEGSIMQTRNLALRLNSQNKDQVTTARNGHLSSRVWSPTNLRMVTHQKDVYCRLGIWHLDLTQKTKTRGQLPGMVTYHPGDGHPPTQAWPPTKRMYTNRLEIYV